MQTLRHLMLTHLWNWIRRYRASIKLKGPTYLKEALAGVSLIALGLGFLTLGLLSFASTAQTTVGDRLDLSAAFRNAGNAATLLAGAVFTVGACLYWKRFPVVNNYRAMKPKDEKLQSSYDSELRKDVRY